MKYLKSFESRNERIIVFIHKINPRMSISVSVSPDGRITNIENKTGSASNGGIRFPFSIDQSLSRNIEVWACNNKFYMNGKDTCPEKKIFGVRVRDVPHEWRHIFPNEFR